MKSTSVAACIRSDVYAIILLLLGNGACAAAYLRDRLDRRAAFRTHASKEAQCFKFLCAKRHAPAPTGTRRAPNVDAFQLNPQQEHSQDQSEAASSPLPFNPNVETMPTRRNRAAPPVAILPLYKAEASSAGAKTSVRPVVHRAFGHLGTQKNEGCTTHAMRFRKSYRRKPLLSQHVCSRGSERSTYLKHGVVAV